MFVLNVIFVLFCATSIHGFSGKSLCDFNDIGCLIRSGNHYLREEIQGKHGLWPRSDPLYRREISGETSISFKYTNAKLTGMEDGEVVYLSLNPDNTFGYILGFNKLIMDADYELYGFIENHFIEGKGSCRDIREDYRFIIKGTYETYRGRHGKIHIRVTSYEIKTAILGKVTYDYKNLMHGDERKSAEVHAWANKNFRKVERQNGDHVMRAWAEEYLKNLDQYTEALPAEYYLNYESFE